jgi:hypothetical protein
MTIITKQTLETMILEANEEKKAQIVGRACLALFRRQTEAEKADNDAKMMNNRGFTKGDAREGCLTAKSFIKNGTLQDWQVEQWLSKNVKGVMRIVKYWAQLDEEAQAKMAARA